jgi:hypothetical protein
MTVVICLNYGDKIYVASDSLMTSREPNGRLRHQGYRLKLYPIPYCNVVVAFSGSGAIATSVIANILNYTFEKRPTETALFEQLSSLITDAVKQIPPDKVQDFDILFAGLVPHSKAYDQEVYPGAGIPPKTACGVFSWRNKQENHLMTVVGKAKHVPSGFGVKFISSNPQSLMDVFVIGSGAKDVIPSTRYYHRYYEWRHQSNQFIMMMIGTELSGFFSEVPGDFQSEIPADNPGVGGEYQVALITEKGIESHISTANEPIRPVTIEFKHDAFIEHDAYIVTDLSTGKSDVIQSILDQRDIHEIYEMGYLL